MNQFESFERDIHSATADLCFRRAKFLFSPHSACQKLPQDVPAAISKDDGGDGHEGV